MNMNHNNKATHKKQFIVAFDDPINPNFRPNSPTQKDPTKGKNVKNT